MTKILWIIALLFCGLATMGLFVGAFRAEECIALALLPYMGAAIIDKLFK